MKLISQKLILKKLWTGHTYISVVFVFQTSWGPNQKNVGIGRLVVFFIPLNIISMFKH